MRVMIIDDDQALSRSLCILLGTRGHQAQAFATRAEAIAALPYFKPDAVLADLVMPEGERLADLARLRWAIPSSARLIVITGHTDRVASMSVDEIGGASLLPKPLDLDQLTLTLEADSSILSAEGAAG